MAIFTSGTTPFVLKAGEGITIRSASNTNGSLSIAGEQISKSIGSNQDYWLGPFDEQREVVVTVSRGSIDVTVGVKSSANIDNDGKLVGATGSQIPTTALKIEAPLGSAGLWWDFQNTQGRNRLADKAAFLTLANTLGTPLTLSGTQPYVAFNNSGALQSNPAAMRAVQRSIFDLSTLTTEQMIVMWGVFTHGTTAGSQTGTLFFWGRSNPSGGGCGWGVQAFGGANTCKVRVYHTPQGGSNNQMTLPASFDMVGDDFLNTKTAFAVTVTRNHPDADIGNVGRGSGLFRFEFAKAGLVNQGLFGQVNSHCIDIPRIPSGVAPANYCDTGLTIGARPTTGPTTTEDRLPANWGLDTIGFQRRKRQSSFAQVLVRQLAEQYRTNPNVIIQPPAAAN